MLSFVNCYLYVTEEYLGIKISYIIGFCVCDLFCCLFCFCFACCYVFVCLLMCLFGKLVFSA